MNIAVNFGTPLFIKLANSSWDVHAFNANPNIFADGGESALIAACDRFGEFANRDVVRLLLKHSAMPLARHGDSIENAITRVAALGAEAAPACLAMMLEYTGLDDLTRKLLLQRWKGYSDQIKAALVADVFDKE
jgi:hypothetical protein